MLPHDGLHDGQTQPPKQQILAANAEGLSRHIEVQKRVAQVLTAEQRAKARAALAESPREGRCRRGGGR